jgi:sensor histidine kinase YesM
MSLMRSRGARARFVNRILIWTVIGLFQFTDVLPGRELLRKWPWQEILTIELVAAYIWALMTPVVFWLGRRFPIERPHLVRHFMLHLPLSVSCALAHTLVFSAIALLAGVGKSFMQMSVLIVFASAFSAGVHSNIFTYWMILAVFHASRYRETYLQRDREAAQAEVRASELRAQLRQAQLTALKTQLEPHFLFNTMNAIAVLVRQGHDAAADEMLSRLGELLARVVSEGHAQEVPLGREVEYLRLYLAIEQVRFRDRLHIEIAVGLDLEDAAVPYLCLLPLVENAIRHGVARSSASGIVRIGAARVGDGLLLSVQDNGPGFAGLTLPTRPGIGLVNTTRRLETLYGDLASLRVERPASGGTSATIMLPYRPIKAPASRDAPIDAAVPRPSV